MQSLPSLLISMIHKDKPLKMLGSLLDLTF